MAILATSKSQKGTNFNASEMCKKNTKISNVQNHSFWWPFHSFRGFYLLDLPQNLPGGSSFWGVKIHSCVFFRSPKGANVIFLFPALSVVWDGGTPPPRRCLERRSGGSWPPRNLPPHWCTPFLLLSMVLLLVQPLGNVNRR